MQDINYHFECNLNSCLASNCKSDKSSTRYHPDDETSLDRIQGLYVAPLGTERTLDFHPQESDKRCKAEFSFQTPDLSLYIMKPGCQDFLVHKVRGASSSEASLYGLSFRYMLPV